MGVEVPSNPINRKEQYLAKIAGQAVEVPAEPLTREEAYLDEIAKNGSGGSGGTTNYNELDNKPQIAGTTLSGNKSLADLGIASASALANKVDKVEGKGLSTNDYDDTEKQKNADNATAITGIKNGTTINDFAGVENVLSNKQNTILNGTTAPTSQGVDNDVYMQLGTSGNVTSLKLELRKGRDNNNTEAQLSRLRMIDSLGNEMQWPEGTIATCNKACYNNEGAQNLISGSAKCCVHDTLPATIIITLPEGSYIDLSVYNRYQFYTCSDMYSRDMVTWNFYTSSDGVNYTKVDSQENYNITLTRNVIAYTSNSIAIPNKVNDMYYKQNGSWLKFDKQDTLTFDDTPTDGSNNPVKSNGIYDSEKDIYAAMGEMGAKNLIPYPYNNSGSYSQRGIDFTSLSDGTIKANGTNDGTGNSTYNFKSFTLSKGVYVVNGCSIQTGNNYRLGVVRVSDDTTLASDSGSGANFTLDADTDVKLFVQVFNGRTVNNTIFKPMLRLASDTDNTYQPYAKTNKQLTDDVALLDSKKTDTDMVAADFDAGTSYTAGNYCIYGGKFYKFKNNHSGAWSAADVDEVKITGELSALKSGLTWKNVISAVSFASGITVADARAYANDNMFILTFLLDITSIAGTDEIVIGSIANPYAPSGKWRFTGMSYSEVADSGTANMISLSANGSISVEHTGGKPYIEGTLMVPLIN